MSLASTARLVSTADLLPWPGHGIEGCPERYTLAHPGAELTLRRVVSHIEHWNVT
jgi:hypothetical protein